MGGEKKYLTVVIEPNIRVNSENEHPPGITCKVRFKRVVHWLWNIERGDFAKTSTEDKAAFLFRELFVYIFFLFSVFYVSVISKPATDQYNILNVIDDRLLYSTGVFDFESPRTLDDVSTVPQMWSYINVALIPFVLQYDQILMNNHLFVGQENILLGKIRLRKLSVRNATCPTKNHWWRDTEGIPSMIHDCYGEFTSDNNNQSGQNYSTQGGQWFLGEISSYPESGEFVDLPRSFEGSWAETASLQTSGWVQKSTRFVSFEFSLFSPNSGVFSSYRVFFELPASGAVIPQYIALSRTLPLDREYRNPVLFPAQIIICAYIVYYLLGELVKLEHHGWFHIKQMVSYFDLFVLLVGVAAMSFRFYVRYNAEVEVLRKFDEYMEERDWHYSLWANLKDIENYDHLLAAFNFLCWIKLLQYVSFSKSTNILFKTLRQSGTDLIGFFFMFTFVFVVFGQIGNLLFGSQNADYNSIVQAIVSLFHLIVGVDGAYDDLRTINPTVGPLYFLLFIALVFFVLLNVFLAILTDTYQLAKEEASSEKNSVEVSDLIIRSFRHLANKIPCCHSLRQNRSVEHEIVLHDILTHHGSQQEKTRDLRQAQAEEKLESWKQHLRALNYNEKEIREVFAVDELRAVDTIFEGEHEPEDEETDNEIHDSEIEMFVKTSEHKEMLDHVRAEKQASAATTSTLYRVERIMKAGVLKFDLMQQAKEKQRAKIEKAIEIIMENK